METVRKIGSYEVESEIGQGGMGVVFLGRQPSLDRPVVLKKLRRDLTEHPRLIERFEREARSAASVHHQNVVAIYDTFAFRSDRYIVAEYVRGEDLKTILARSGRITSRIAALIALEVARGLEEIHARGIVHRDLKPANVLIGHRGETKIADFGIALGVDPEGLTRPGMLLGSPPYVSPEQMLGERAEYRSDLWSFGVLLYELITGAQPFPLVEEEAEEGLLRRVQRGLYEPVRKRNPAAPRRLARLARVCLRPRVKARPASATSVRRALERHLGCPSPADCREEIAFWLWQRGVFQRAEDQTVRVPTRPAAALRQRRAAVGRGLAAAAALVLLHGLWLLATAPEPGAAVVALPAQKPPLSLDVDGEQEDAFLLGDLRGGDHP